MLVRCTAKALSLLGAPRGSLAADPATDDDWYLNLLWIERRKCLLLVHAGTLFAILAIDVRKPQITPFGPYVVGLVQESLVSEDLPPNTLGRLDPANVRLGRTASRSVLGTMNQMAFEISWIAERDGGLTHLDMADVNRFLRRSLHGRGGGYVVPIELARERALWS